MSKKITIPTCMSPFKVTINGEEYTYPSGAEVEVPDEVAHIVECHENTLHKPIEEVSGGGSSSGGGSPEGAASSAVSAHNTNTDAHNDIRLLIDGLSTRLNALANSTDDDLDQMAEIVAYIKANKALIEQVTTNKVSVADIINNLTTNVTNRPLSAAQGVALKALIDAIIVPTKVSQLTNDKGYLTSYTESDPTVPSWAKQSSKPSYNANEVGAVAYIAQSLAEEQKAQARENIGALDKSQLPTITQEAGQSESLVMSQKAVTDLVVKDAQKAPLFVSGIEDCTDNSMLYVLPDSFIYAYMTKTTVQPEVNPNVYILSEAEYNARLSGSSGSVTSNSNNGACVTGFIALPNFSNVDSYIVRINGVNFTTTNYQDDKFVLYNSSKSRIGSSVMYPEGNSGSTGNTAHSSTGSVVDLKVGITGTSSGATYVRFQFQCTQTEFSNLTITFDANRQEGGVNTESGWLNTGIAFVPADYEDRIRKNEADIDILNGLVAELQKGTNNDTVAIPSFWQSAVNTCISKIKALQVGRNCVTFPFFSDNHQRNGYAGMLIAHIMKECNIPYCFYGGDSIDSGYIASEAVMIAQDKAFDTAMSYIPNGRFCRAVGNHDGYWAVDANNKNYYTDAQNYELFLREESVAQNKHFGGDGTYYYVDDIASKVRWIVMDTNDGVVEAEQISWLQNTALSFNESGWAVVFISHQPISNHYHANISNAEAVRTVVANYVNGSSANKAVVVGWFSGHIHRDRIYTGVAVNTTDDSVGAAMPFKQVTITSDHTGIAYDDATKHTVANDNQSHAIDFVTINKTTRKVNLTRLGIGSDRSYTY